MRNLGRSRALRLLRARSAPDRQAGELLVETMMTVAIIGISFVAVFSAVFTAIRIADYTAKTSKADAVVRAYAEVVKSPDIAYVPCASAGSTVTYPATINPWTPPAPYNVQYSGSIIKIRYLSGYSATGVPTWSNTCPATDLGTQEITLRATGPLNDPSVKGSEQVVITKRDARGDL
jgi:hypothetical protein